MDEGYDDKTTTKIVDHISIRDPLSGEVFVNKRGEQYERIPVGIPTGIPNGNNSPKDD